jgi:4'-phosphopantetheinyl transferase
MPLPDCPWPLAPATLNLSSEEVHVWCFALDQSPDLAHQLAATLASDERERAARFHFEHLRTRFATGRGALRTILGRYLQIPPQAVRFSYGNRGKPSLAPGLGRDCLRFNLSHSESLALLAVTDGRELGVDLEHLRAMPDADSIAEHFFAPSERLALRGVPPSEKSVAFFNCWTRKEAYIKAWGEGLYMALDQFDVTLLPGQPARLLRVASDPTEPTRWAFESLTPTPDYIGALAIAGHDWRLVCWQWP